MAVKKMRPASVLLLLLLLVGLPIGSWYYLRLGLDYRLDTKAELQDFGPMPAFELKNFNDSLIGQARFEEGLTVGYFFSEPHAALYGQKLAQLFDQYDERDDVLFVAFQADTSAAARARAEGFLREYQAHAPEQVFFLAAAAPEIRTLAQAFQIPFEEKGMTLSDNALLFFADGPMLRGFYDMRQEEDIKRLVRHITISLPLKREKELIFKRDKEI
jgi:hypothetical protein